MDSEKNLADLRVALAAVEKNMDMATAFHEVWKPSAYDADLHGRLGTSFASQAFGIVRAALRREMLLALMRIWDEQSGAQSLRRIMPAIADESIWQALIVDRTRNITIPLVATHVAAQLESTRHEATKIHSIYAQGGERFEFLLRLKKLRHGDLAHTQAARSKPEEETGDAEIEDFFQHTALMISRLLSVVNGVAYSFQDTADVYKHYAQRFWNGVRGENTEGHPDHRPSPL